METKQSNNSATPMADAVKIANQRALFNLEWENDTVFKKRELNYKTKVAFQRDLEAGKISKYTTVFIKDSKEIYKNGQYYGSSEGGGSSTGVGKVDSNSDGTGEIFNNYEGEDLNISKGNSSHAEGKKTQANSNGSHAEGIETIAGDSSDPKNGKGAHAEGQVTTALGNGAHAEGYNTKALKDRSHAEGYGTKADNQQAHAEGYYTTATGINSHIEGKSTIQAPEDITEATEVDTIIEKWDKSTSVHDNKFSLSHGQFSHGEGYDTLALGNYSHAEGSLNIAKGECSHAEGFFNEASGINSHAEGDQNQASGVNAHVEGSENVASNTSSHAEGQGTIASGKYSHAEGIKTQATGDGSHVEGDNCIAMGANSHVEGQKNYTTGRCSHVEGGELADEVISLVTLSNETKTINGYQYNCSKDIPSAFKFGGKIYKVLSHFKIDKLYYVVIREKFETLNKEINITLIRNYSCVDYSHVEGFKCVVLQSNDNFESNNFIGNHAEGCFTESCGESASHSEGYITIASGRSAHSEGNTTIASGNYSHSEGFNSKASGQASHTEGSGTIAKAEGGHAEGIDSVASEAGAHAEGSSQARGKYSHSEGQTTIASGNCSHAEGQGTEANGDKSHAEGNNSNANGQHSHAEGYATKANGDNSHAECFATNATGNCSHAEGYSTKAIGNYSHSEGGDTSADGEYSHAEGEYSIASGWYSHAEGFQTKSLGEESHAEGRDTQAKGNNAHAEGYSTIAENDSSHAEGYKTKATGYSSHAEGYFTESNGEKSHAEGDETKSNGRSSHVEGQNGVANADYSHAEGFRTISLGEYSHAEGGGAVELDESFYTKTKDEIYAEWERLYKTPTDYETGDGFLCAAGKGSHSEGKNTLALADFSHTSGEATVAKSYCQTVIGRFNEPATSGYNEFSISNEAFVIGNGTDISSKGNAFKVLFNGQTYADGAYSGSGADYAEFFEWKDGNESNEDRVGLFVSIENDKIVKATKDSKYILGIVSGNPSVIGDNPMRWKNKYLTDKFGRPIYEEVEVKKYEKKINDNGEEEIVETIEKQKIFKINPEWDSSKEYISRENRKEWSAIGLMGKLIVRHDGTLKQGGFCYPSENGIATNSETGYYVMKVYEDTALIMFK